MEYVVIFIARLGLSPIPKTNKKTRKEQKTKTQKKNTKNKTNQTNKQKKPDYVHQVGL